MFENLHKIASLIGSVFDREDDISSLTSNISPIAKRLKPITDRINKLQNSITIFRYKHPKIRRALDAASGAITGIFSSKVSRIIGVSIAGIAFTTSLAAPPVAIAMLTASSVGFGIKIAANINQTRNLRKTQEEERSLERLVRHKHKALKIASAIKLTPDIARLIGLSTLALPPTTDGSKLSKTDRAELLNKLQNNTLSATERKAIRSQLARFKSQAIASQKYDAKHATVGSAARKILLADSLKIVGDISTVAANILSPIGLTIASVSAATGLISDTRERYAASDQKQALKNSIELFRRRSDIPGYDSLEELHEYSRKAQLEAKALAKLSTNSVFTMALKEQNIPALQELVIAAKQQVIFEEKAIAASKELALLGKEKKKAVEKKVSEDLSTRFNEYKQKATGKLHALEIVEPSDRQVLQAMKELAKIEAKQYIDKYYLDRETECKKVALQKGAMEYASFIRSGDKSNIIAQYEQQDNLSRWQKFKKLMSDIGSAFNIFSTESVEVKKPHNLLIAEHLAPLAVHANEYTQSHTEEKQIYSAQRREVMAIHQHLMGRSLLSPYTVTARKILSPTATPTVTHKTDLTLTP